MLSFGGYPDVSEVCGDHGVPEILQCHWAELFAVPADACISAVDAHVLNLFLRSS